MLRYLENVATIKLDAQKCNGCRMCLKVCPQAVFTMEKGKAKLADRDACMECGACAVNCESQALTVTSGVGCAAGVIAGMVKGTGPVCECSGNSSGSSCC